MFSYLNERKRQLIENTDAVLQREFSTCMLRGDMIGALHAAQELDFLVDEDMTVFNHKLAEMAVNKSNHLTPQAQEYLKKPENHTHLGKASKEILNKYTHALKQGDNTNTLQDKLHKIHKQYAFNSFGFNNTFEISYDAVTFAAKFTGEMEGNIVKYNLWKQREVTMAEQGNYEAAGSCQKFARKYFDERELL